MDITMQASNGKWETCFDTQDALDIVKGELINVIAYEINPFLDILTVVYQAKLVDGRPELVMTEAGQQLLDQHPSDFESAALDNLKIFFTEHFYPMCLDVHNISWPMKHGNVFTHEDGTITIQKGEDFVDLGRFIYDKEEKMLGLSIRSEFVLAHAITSKTLDEIDDMKDMVEDRIETGLWFPKNWSQEVRE